MEIKSAPLSEKAVLLLLAAVQFTHMMDFMVLMPLGPQLMRILHIHPDQFSLVVAAYSFSAALAGLIGATLVDRFDRKKALLFCYAGFLCGTAACAFAPTYHFLLLARIVSGAFGGVSGAMVLTIAGDVTPLERRARGMGVIMAAFSVASVAGVPAGLWLATHGSWHLPFLMIVVVGAGVWLFCLARLQPLRSHLDSQTRQSLQGLWELLSTKNPRTALIFMALMVFGHFIVIPFLSPSLVRNAGLQESDLSWVYFAGGAASLFTAPLFGRLADKHGRFRIFIITILGSIPTVYLVTRQGPAALGWILTLSVGFFVFAGGRFVPGQAIITSAVPPRLRGSFMSLNSSVRDFSAGAASLLGGHIVVEEAATGRLLHFPTLGWIAIAVSLLSATTAGRVKAVA